MLARLQAALGCPQIGQQMVLISPSNRTTESTSTINLVVGYNGSPQSQTALDLTLWIAHQTRLATPRSVTVQVVYVVNEPERCPTQRPGSVRMGEQRLYLERILDQPSLPSGPGAATMLVDAAEPARSPDCWLDQVDQADRILWQARQLADEWRGSLKTHLRFGTVATELRDVVQAESASLLVLGCRTARHPLVQALGSDFYCPVLGLPAQEIPLD